MAGQLASVCKHCDMPIVRDAQAGWIHTTGDTACSVVPEDWPDGAVWPKAWPAWRYEPRRPSAATGKPAPATHVFLFRMRRPETFMQGAIPAQEAAIKALEARGWEFCTGHVEFGAVENTAARLSRIAESHHKYVGPAGLTSGCCNECGLNWPCPTYAWATQDRDPNSCWDPNDDEQAEQDGA